MASRPVGAYQSQTSGCVGAGSSGDRDANEIYAVNCRTAVWCGDAGIARQRVTSNPDNLQGRSDQYTATITVMILSIPWSTQNSRVRSSSFPGVARELSGSRVGRNTRLVHPAAEVKPSFLVSE
ncbi:hypothetical protein RRG08_008555 [Elysia crispata]|uniref:Uncharacterized protein n=1 Tax=Elysia crispata TaxID=231223 RepID=A0AAE0YMG2_9GAST|nr:hypothetical protein RRG08_008555 [Elysia crispata]